MINKSKIIGIMGNKYSGKDTSADHLVANHNFVRYGMADPLKAGAMAMFGFTHEQMYGTKEQKETVDPRWGISPRRVLELLGTELLQYDIHKYTTEGEFPVGRRIWVRKFELWYEEELKTNPTMGVVFSDIRFPHEADFIREMGGSILEVFRPNNEANTEHKSETEMKLITPDLRIINDTTFEELYKKLDKFLVGNNKSSMFAE